MAKRKKTSKIKEEEYEVTVDDTSPNAKMKTSTTTVSATNPQDAMRTVTKDRARSTTDVVTVGKKDDMDNMDDKSGGVYSMESFKTKSIRLITESVTYPYSISLPVQFKIVLESIGVEHKVSGTMVEMIFENKSGLAKTLRALHKNGSSMAVFIRNGLNGSV